ncbi:hypothetical protein EJV46_16135 [Roseococcus sp. SYP-B2431]|uniref:type I restriction enzyme HsdR N-terminal domain-containing protein n=1 Tax=Roseococcus sp. SYP-B2431 TaxID=2496640 RepID=UPI001039E246|nr:type I restriction enzyme HsdR N-terminal domain-containing protein [Roseococcus sp. SYP-B2431]TCH97645.1 hypothetical protein EJV46_16135 [Roseococcus sp. SYP-B2431]
MDEFREKLRTFAQRMVALAPRCTNEESTKLFLILPFLNFLGYDDRNPDEVCPEHGCDFSEKYKNRVDFAILRGEAPVIALECKTLGMALRDERGQLRSYFNAAPTVKMGIIADGLVYEFYADSDEPNMMDQSAFLSLDLREIAKGKIEDSVEEGLRGLQKSTFDPENIGAEAKRKLIFQNIVLQLGALAQDPSEPFVRMLLQKAGVSHVRAKSLDEYRDLTKSAFREFVNQRILRRLDLPTKDDAEKAAGPSQEVPVAVAAVAPTDAVETTAAELQVMQYVRKRLAFLVKEERLYDEISNIEFKDYKGKMVAFYRRERAGRLFDFREGKDASMHFDFGAAGGELAVSKLSEIDTPLLAVYRQRVEELAPAEKRAVA